MEGPPAKKSKLSPTGDAQDLWTIVSDVESKLPEELGNIKTSYDIPSTDENGDASRIHDAGMDAISSNILSGDIVVTINSQDNPFSNVFPASQNAAHNPSDGLSSTTVTSVLQQQQHMMRQPLQQHLLIAQTRQMLNSSQPQLVTILPPSSVSLPGQMQRFQIHMSSGNNHSNARMLQLPLVINNNNNILNANNLLASNNNDMNNFGTPCGSNQVQPQNRQNVMTIMVPGRPGNQVSLSQQIMLNGNIMTANQGSWSSNNTANGNGIQQPIAGSTPLVVMDNNTSQARLVTVPSRLQKLVLISTVGNATPNSNSLSVSNSNNFVHNQTNMIGHTLINNDTVPRLKFPPAQQNQLQQSQQTIQQSVLINNAVLDQQHNFLQTSTSVGGQMSLPSTSNLNASHAITSTPLQPQSSTTAPPNRSSGITDPNKQNLIRQQLVLLLHAHKCQKRDLSQNGVQGTSACKMPHCETMKKVLRHMAECRDGKICKVPHCASSRQIITHYKNCPRNGCSVCMPIKNNLNPTAPPVATSGNVIIGSAGSSVLSSAPNISQNVQQHPQQLVQQQTHQGLVKAYMALGLTQQQIYQQTIAQHQEQQTCNGVNLHIGPNSLSANSSELADFGNINGASGGSGSSSRAVSQLGSTDSAPVKEWHKSITQDLRNHLVHKLVQAIFPTPDPDILKDVRIKNLVQYSRKVEGDMYETANTREEYYHLLAAKIYRIQKELEEKKMKRSQLENQQLQQTQLHNSIRFPTTNSRQPMPNGPSNSQPRQPNIQGTTRNSTPVPNILVSNNQAAPSPNFLTSSPQQQLQDILMKHQRIDQQSPQSRMFQASTWPSNQATTTSAPMSSPAQMGSSGFLSPTSGFMSPSAGNSDLSALFATDTIKKEPSSQPPVEAQTSVRMEDVSMGDSSCTKDAIKTESVLTSFGSASKVCQSKEMQKDKVMLDTKADDGFADPNNDLLLHPTSSSSSSSITPINKTVWKPNELRQYLLPTLEKLYRLDESLPFRQPVDPVVLQIPDYFDIIKNPMDLSTIKKNLDSGGYSDPWQYVEDVWLMFENAWLYNRKTSRVHKFSTKLSEVFEPEIDGVMRSLGFCCGRKYVFSPQALCCYGKTMCTIPINAVYYSHQNRYVFCEKCFLETEGDEMELNEDPMQPNIRIKKELFEKTKNNQLEMEPFVECSYCGKKQHQICSLYLESVWQGPFVCMSCSATNNVKRKENRYTSKRLPQTKLGTYLENRVNSFLKKNGCGAGEVTIRVLSSSEKTVEVKPAMKLRHGEDIADSFPYTAKSIFAFEEIDGVSVCFFGMHVQEYGSNCPQPNARRIYIAYLDSVNFFQPKAMRTPVYHEILIGYLDYVKKLGYATAHIWACPPSEGDDYIFHCHPPDMKIPKPKRLQDWYKKMLDKAILERIVVDYKDILRDAIENNLSSAIELPYFEGDFWPTVLEDSIKEVEIEEDRKRKESENEALSIAVSLSSSSASSSCSMFGTTTMNSISFPDTSMMDDQNSMDVDDGNTSGGAEPSQSGKKKGQKSAVKKKNSKNKGGSSGSASSKKTGNKKNQPPRIEAANGNELTTKLFQMMEKHKEVFFVVKLHPVQNIPALPHIQDPDQYVSNDLMDGRDAFLMMSRERHYEFSSLRRAKFSTLVMLYELHTQGREAFGYSCNNCKANIETHFHCTVCEDFDLCVSCYEKLNHVHKMEKRSLDLDGSGPGGSSGLGGIAGGHGGGIGSGEGSSDGSNLVNPQEARRHSIQKCIQSLLHACTCRDANCRLASCQKMKRVMNHTKLCKRKQTNNCPVCKQLFALCWYHAKHCRESKCQVPFCLNFKQKLQQQQTQQKMQQAMLMRRRIEAMLQNGSGTGSSLSSSSSSSLQAHHQSIPQKLTSVGNVVPASPSTHQAALTNRLILHQQQLQQQQFQQIQVMDSSQASISNGGGSQQIIGALISSDSNSQMSTLKLQLQQPLVVQHGDVPQSTANTMWIEGMQHQQDAVNILMTTASSTSLASNFSVVTAATTQLIGAPLNSRPVPSSPLSVEKQRKLLNLFQSNPQLLHALLKQKQQQQQQQQPFAAPSVSLLNQQQQQIQDVSQQDQNLVMKQQQTRLLLNPRLQTGMNNPRVLMPTFKQPQHIRLAQQTLPSSMIRLPPNDQLILQSSNNVNIQHSQQQQLVKMQHYHPALNNVTARAATNPLLRSQLQQQQIVQRMTAARLNIPVSLGLNSSSLQHQASANNSRVIGSTTSAPIMLLMNNNEQVDGQQTRPDQVMLTQLHTDLPSTNAPSSSNTNSHGYGDPNSAVVIPQDQLSRYADQL